ncbi:hypothetical protein BOX15_Mlig000329g1 [Macrostomum lignano]|uniref:GPS domain-containing protein n=2 Tax=Macrostomum lignano TaxID=282301 RepID=A0A267GUR9_9PLAT|nr:hypothetical protein BOX15_Mlig000329g1 [Macrostomum lignano]
MQRASGHFTMAAFSLHSLSARPAPATHTCPEAFSRASRHVCNSLQAGVGEPAIYSSTVHSRSIGFQPSWLQNQFFIEQICRTEDCWHSLTSAMSNVSATLFTNATNGSDSHSLISYTTLSSSNGVFNGYFLTITFNKQVRVTGFGFMGAGNNLRIGDKPVAYAAVKLLFFEAEAAAWVSAATALSLNKSLGLSMEPEDMLNQAMIFHTSFAIVTQQLRIMPAQYRGAAAFKFDIFGCVLSIPTCVGKNSLQFGGMAIGCEHDWMIVYRNLNTTASMNLSIVNYQAGFEFENLTWPGLQVLSDLTNVEQLSLRFDAWVSDGSFRYMECRRIKVAPAYLKFGLHVEDCSSDFGDQHLFEALNASTFSNFDFGYQTSCATAGGSGWWYTPGCDGLKLTGCAGCAGSDAIRWSSSTSAGAQVAMRLINKNYFHPAKAIGEACNADASCSLTGDTVCLSSGQLLDTRCSCRKGFVRVGVECKSLIDSSVQSLSLPSPLTLVRNVPTNLSIVVHIRILNGTANLTSAAASGTNFNFGAHLRGESLNGTIDSIMVIGGDPAAARSIGEDFEISLSLEIKIPPGSACLRLNEVCIFAQPGDTSRFVDYQLNNNEACIGIVKLCQPQLKVDASVRLQSPEFVTRSLPALITLETSLTLDSTSAVSVAAVPQPEDNFILSNVLLCSENCSNSSECLIVSCQLPAHWTAAASRESVPVAGSTIILSNASNTFNLSACESYSFACAQVATGPNSSLVFANTSVRIACTTLPRNCTPHADVEIGQVAFVVNNATWIRRYPASLTVSYFLHLRSGLPIEEVPPPRTNFQPMAFLASEDLAVSEMSTFTKCDQGLLRQGLQNSTQFDCVYMFNVTADACPSLKKLCVIFNSSTSPSYTESDSSNNVGCVALLNNLSCAEVSVLNASCQVSASLLTPNDTLTVTAAWLRGSAVQVSVSFSNNRSLTWNWLTAGHTSNFESHSATLKIVFGTDVGRFNFTCIVGNAAGDWQTADRIDVVPQLSEFLRLSMTYLPEPVPLNATLSFEMIRGSPISNLPISCYAKLQPNSHRNFSKTLQPVGIFNEILTFSEDSPFALANVTCWNQLSSITAAYYVILQQNITSLWFNSSQTVVPTNHTFQLEFSVTTGSHVTYQINLGNGSTFSVTDGQILAWKASESLNLSYESPGLYVITNVASNFHTQSERRSLSVLVQNPVRQLILLAPKFVELFSVNSSFEFFHPDPQPTNATCRIKFGNMTVTKNLSVEPVWLPIRCYRDLLLEPELVELTCWNLVSARNVSNATVHCQEAVNGLAWSGPLALRRAEAGFYVLSVLSGSSLRTGIDCGDGRIQYPPNATGNISVQYPSVGNFTTTVSVWNDVSNKSVTFGPIVVQEAVRGLVLEYNSTVLYTPAEVQFRLSSSEVDLNNLHCVFSWAQFGSRYLYVSSLSTVGEVTLAQVFTRAALGVRNFSLNCSNLISFQSIPITVDIVLDAVIIGSFRTNGTTLLSNATYFFLNITRFGTNGCFVVDFGDSTNISFGVPALCQPYSASRGINFTAISYENMSISFSHIYPQLGGFSATVFAFNHVSNDTAETLATIMDWMCEAPQLNFSHFGVQLAQWDPSMPLQQMRSQEVLVSGLPELNCSKTSATVRRWRVEAVTGTVTNLSFPDLLSFRLPPRSLWYGLYKVVLNLSMAEVTPPVSAEFAFYLNITKTPISVNFSSSSPVSVAYNRTVRFELDARDWDVEAGNLTAMSFRWICMQQSELTPNPSTSFIRPPDMQDSAEFRGCFGNGVGVISEGNEHTAAALVLSTWHLMPNLSYVLRVDVFKDSRSAFSEWTIFLSPQALPTILIGCVSNCAEKVSARIPLAYEASCKENCGTKFDNLSFTWAMRQLQAGGFEDLAVLTESGYTSSRIVRRENTLISGVVYLVQVSASSFAQEGPFTVSKTFVVNKPASGGNCTIEPREGIAMETKFRISCWSWVEFNVTASSLTYEYRIRPKGNLRTILLFYGPTAVSPEVVLPVGSSTHGYKTDAYINVVDSLGDKIAFIFDVTVYPPAIPASELLAGISDIMDGTSDKLSQHLKSGNQQGAATTLMCLTSVMNAKNEDAEGANATSEERTAFNRRMAELRTKLVEVVANFSLNSPEDLEQTNDVLRTAFPPDRTDQITVNAQELGASKLQEVTDSFGKFKEKLQKDVQPLMGSDIVFTGSNIWSASDATAKANNANNESACSNSSQINCLSTTPATGTEELSAKVRGVIESVLTTVESVTEILLNSSGSYSISDSALSVQGVRLNGSNDSVSFQSALGDASLPQLSGCDSFKAVFSGRSPYVWQPKTSVASPVLMIDKRGCRSRRAAAPSSSESFTFSLPATAVGEKAVVNATPTDRWLSFYHSVNVTFGVLEVTVLPINVSHALQVFVQLDRLPTPLEYLINASQGSFYLPAVSNGTYFIGVQRDGCYREPSGEVASSCPDPSLSYEFGLSQYDCLVWDAVQEIWTKPSTAGASCTVEASDVPNRPRFVSNLFGSLGAGMNVLPNLIDFGKLFDNWQGKLADSAAVVGTVVALWVIFIPIAVWLRRVDNKDSEKFKYLPLIDDANEKFVYRIDVYTASDRSNAGTRICPLLSVSGELHREPLRVMSDGIRQNFQPGDINHFTMTTGKHLGDILEIEFSLEGQKPICPWMLQKIIITDSLYNVSYIFNSSETILPYQEPIAIALANKEQLAFQQRFVRNNLSRKFLDDHLWMSVVKRKTDTNFSRLQRFGVCFCLLFLTMISNAMFYGVGEGGESASDTITIGPIKLSVNTLFTSMLGAVVVVPVSAAVTIFFLKSKRSASNSATPSSSLENSDAMKESREMSESTTDDGVFDLLETGIVYRSRKSADSRTLKSKDVFSNPASTPLVPQASEMPSTGFQLPHWCQYVGWALVLGSMLGAGVFLVFYAMQWGKEKSQQWLLSFVLSFVQTAFLVQPLKVALIGLVLIVIFRKDYDVENFTLIRVRYFNEEHQREGIAFLYELEAKARQNPVRKAAISATVKLVLTLLLLLLQYCICYGNIDPGTFRLHESIKQHLNYKDLVAVDGTATELYKVINSSILPAVFADSASFLISDGCGYRLSRLSVRQLRRPRPRQQRQSPFASSTDETGCFLPGWTAAAPCNLSASPLEQAFMNRPDGAPYSGILAEYRGGGFVALLPEGLAPSRAFLAELQRLGWLDSSTSLLVVELDLFYSDVNLFTAVAMASELNSFGGAQASEQILSTRLYRYVGAVGVFALVSEILAGLLLLLRIVFLAIQLRNCRQFWANFENWLDMGVIIFMVAACIFYGLRTAGTGSALEAAVNGGQPQLRQLLLLNEFFFYSLGFSCFLLQLSLLGLIRFSASLGHLLGTLRSSLSKLSSFSVFFCVIFFAFCWLMNQLLGPVQLQFSSPLGTMSTLFSAMLGKFDMATVSSHGLLPKLAFSLYVSFLMFIVVNLFVVILNDSYEGAREPTQSGAGGSSDFQIVQFVLQRLRDTFVSSRAAAPSYKESKDLDVTINRLHAKFGIIDSMLSSYTLADRKWDSQICLNLTGSLAIRAAATAETASDVEGTTGC